MGGIPEHDQIPQPVDQTQCGHNVRQIIPQQPCGTQGIVLQQINVILHICFYFTLHILNVSRLILQSAFIIGI